jgi:four helix bundle protein
MSDEICNRTTNAKDKPQSYRDLLVWQKSIALAKLIYRLTEEFPPEEKYGLTSQMRRAAVSVPSNIAEGQARHTTGEFVLFLSHAEGSLAELDTQLILAAELGCVPSDKTKFCNQAIAELRRMLNGLRRAVTGQKNAVHHSSPVTHH